MLEATVRLSISLLQVGEEAASREQAALEARAGIGLL
jgi:hypothetical protein